MKEDYIITVGNSFSRITPELDDDDREIVESVMRFRPPGYWRGDKFRSGLWDGWKKLFRRRTQKFPTGLLHRLIGIFDEESISYSIQDDRVDPCPEVYNWDLKDWDLRDYQEMAVTKGILHKRGVFNIGTGGGKTGIAASLWKGLGCPVGAVFVHTKVLLDQHKKFFENRLGCKIGQIGDGVWDPQDLTVALINSLYPPKSLPRRPSGKQRTTWKKGHDRWIRTKTWLKSLDFFFSDECHLIGDNLWYKILSECEAYYRFAGSGTPFGRSFVERHLLVSSTGPILISVPYKRLKKLGYVCSTMLNIIPLAQEDSLFQNTEYAEAYEGLIVQNARRHNLVVSAVERFGTDRKTLILVSRIAHGEHLEAHLKDAGIEVEFIYGGSKKDFRREVLRSFAEGELNVLVASGILDQGLDIPDLSLIINTAGGKIESRAIQKIGRGVRTAPGKEGLIFIDIFDYGSVYLKRHAMHRLNVYQSEGGYTIRVVEEEDLIGS